jgi:uncharacterized protein YndB with AHSA1/START domain
MFEMWTDPKHFSQWLPPTGFKMQFIRCDIKTGGSSFYFMTGAGDTKMYGRAQYLEIEKPNRIVYTQQFCDENEKVRDLHQSKRWHDSRLDRILRQAGRASFKLLSRLRRLAIPQNSDRFLSATVEPTIG